MKQLNTNYVIPYENVQFYLEDGIKKIALLIEETYGPSGKNILFDAKLSTNPEVLKNGSKIIRQLRTGNQVENLIFLMLEDSFAKINSTTGDGTKTFFLLTSSIVLNGFKYIIQNSSALETKIGITKTINYALKILNEKSIPISTKDFWHQVIQRYIPGESNLQLIIEEAFEKIGKSGQIKIKSETGKKTELILERGMQISRGYFSPYFVTDTDKMNIEFSNPYILLTSKKIILEDGYLINLLEPIIYEKRPLLIISPEIDEQALSSLVLNKVNGIIDIAYVKLPQTFNFDKSLLEDLALYTNAKLITSNLDWKGMNRSNLGQAEKILITKTKTVFWAKSDSQEQKIQKKCQELKQQILFSDSDYENERREDRRKNLTGANAIIEIGGITDMETSDLHSRTQIGLVGAKACLYEGVLPGGGFSFVNLSEELENWARSNLYGNSFIGSKLVVNSLLKPLQTLLNQESDTNRIIPKYSTSVEEIKQIRNNYTAYDVKQKKLVNMVECGVIDSFKSIRLGLQTTASLTYSILSIANIIL